MGFLFYKSEQDKKIMMQTLKYLQNENSNKEGKPHRDPYKEIAVSNTLTKKVSDVQNCYNTFLVSNQKKTDGFVEVDWQISPEGKTLKPEVVRTDLENKELGVCITNVLANIVFPPPPSGIITYMTYKYNFKKTE